MGEEVIEVADVHDVAAALLERTGAMTTMKLQKLIYYTQAWHLVFRNTPMFDEQIEAWAEGPVTRVLNEKHRGRYRVDGWRSGNPTKLSADELATLEWVITKYSALSAESLSHMTHMESPWKVARGMLSDRDRSSNPISRDQMRNFYSRQRSEPDVAVSQVAASAAMEGIEFDDSWQQVLRDVAAGVTSADDAIEEEIRRVKGS